MTSLWKFVHITVDFDAIVSLIAPWVICMPFKKIPRFFIGLWLIFPKLWQYLLRFYWNVSCLC